jgi:cytochrome c553
MIRAFSRSIVAIALAFCAVMYWLTPGYPETTARQPDVKQGADIVAQGTSAGAAPCSSCHGLNGAPDDKSGNFPRIAGQSAYYLAKEMQAFAADQRPDDIMTPIAKALAPDEIADTAAYYAGESAPFPQLPAPDAALVARGEQLARVGDATKQVQACNSCHGPDGTGESRAIPYLAGQFSQYITAQLQAWQQGQRKNSIDVMAVIAKKLDDQDIAAIAAYYQQVRAPGAAAAK